MRLQKLIRFGLLLAARASGAAALFGVNLLIINYLGIEALSTYAIFVSLVSVSAVLISAGFTSVAPIFVAEYAKMRQPELHKGFTFNAFKQGTRLLAVLGLVYALAYLSGALAFFEGSIVLGIAALCGAAATAALGFNGAVLVGMKEQVAGLIPETLIRPLIFLFLAAVFLSAGIAVSINEVLWLLVGSIWITLGFVILRNRKYQQKLSKVHREFDKPRWRRASFPWMGITLLWDFLIDIILLFMSIMAGSIEIAILHICFRYRVLAGFGMRTIHALLMPEITEESVIGNKEGLQKKLRQVNLASLAYTSITLFIFAVFGSMLLGLFSSHASTSVALLLVVSATMVIRAVLGPAPLVLAIHNFHMITLKVSAVGVITAVLFILMAYNSIGIMAAAIGYTGANLIVSSLLWHYAKRKTGIDCSLFSLISNKSTQSKKGVEKQPAPDVMQTQ